MARHRLLDEDVFTTLNNIIAKPKAPKRLFVDKGSEISRHMLYLLAFHYRTKIDLSRPWKPTDKCFIETLNGSLRDECHYVHWYASLTEGRYASRQLSHKSILECVNFVSSSAGHAA